MHGPAACSKISDRPSAHIHSDSIDGELNLSLEMNVRLAIVVALSLLVTVEATSCPHVTASRDTKPLYLLTLVPFPDPRPDVGWDGGLGTLPGARVARDEINNRTDLLPGHHIELIEENIEACSLTEAGTGLTNLVKYTVSPPCRPVVAVTGLMCSSHTSIVSPVAGHDGFCLIQLSVANAPLFQTQNNSFPHLWRVLGAGTVYADTTLALMDRFGWRRIGIVYDYGSTYFTHVATYFEKLVRNSLNKKVLFSVGMIDGSGLILEQIAADLRDEAATVLFVAINDHQASKLLCRLEKSGLTYPAYIWVQIGKRLDRILRQNSCKKDVLLKAKQGHIQLHIRSVPSNESTILVSGEKYSNFRHKYNESLEQVEKEYNEDIDPDEAFSNLLYDQVWAFALAMNHSLPVLENRNLSIDNYTIGQAEITEVIEEQMASLKFQGASGVIKFNDQHGVFAVVDIYQVNGTTEDLVGTYVPQLNSNKEVPYNLSLWIDNSSVPDDIPPVKNVLIPLAVACFLYSIAGILMILTTVNVVLLLYFREWPDVKASSPYLSILILIGCYLICIATIFRTTYGSFPFFESKLTYGVLVTLDNFCLLSGLMLVIVTTFFKLLRVHHFFTYMTLKLRQMWRTCSLIILILALSLWISVAYIVAEILMPVNLVFYNYTEVEDNVLTIKRQVEYPANYEVLGAFFTITVSIYVSVFLLLIVYFAIRTRKIEQSGFKDTKKLNFFVAILVVLLLLEILVQLVLTHRHNYWEANVSTTCSTLFLVFCVFAIFFLPKLVPSMFKPRPRRRPSRLSTRASSSRFSVRQNSLVSK